MSSIKHGKQKSPKLSRPIVPTSKKNNGTFTDKIYDTRTGMCSMTILYLYMYVYTYIHVYAYGPKTGPAFLHFSSSDYFGVSDTSSLLRSHIMLGWGRLLHFVAHTCTFLWIRLLYFFHILSCFVGYVFSTLLHILSCYVGYVFSTLFSHNMLRWIRLLYFVAHTFMLCWIRLLDFFAHTFMLRWIRLLYLDSTSLHILSCYVTFTLETIKKMT